MRTVDWKKLCRGVAQPGSALAWGARGPEFKSRRPDHLNGRYGSASFDHLLARAGHVKQSDQNPYAPSRASLQVTGAAQPADAGTGISVWRDGDVLITLPGAAMPHRCVKCNEPADEPTKARKVYWHHPALYLLLLFNIIIYAVTAAIVRKKAFVNAGLCMEHKKRRRNALVVAWTGSFAGAVMMWLGMGSSWGVWGLLLGVLLILASAIGGMIFARIVYAKRIDNSYVRLKGCGIAFLNSLPSFSGQSR